MLFHWSLISCCWKLAQRMKFSLGCILLNFHFVIIGGSYVTLSQISHEHHLWIICKSLTLSNVGHRSLALLYKFYKVKAILFTTGRWMESAMDLSKMYSATFKNFCCMFSCIFYWEVGISTCMKNMIRK